MPFTVQHLIAERPKPVTVPADALAREALDLMIKHQYSQLPVVDDDGKPLGMVTGDSMVRALSIFDVTVRALHVADALIKAREFRAEQDLFELLDVLRDAYAVLIVDGNRKLVGIVTSYDATEYFRQRTEDMMWVEDIELTLKDYIQTAYSNGTSETDNVALQMAITQCTGGSAKARKQFFTALHHYLAHIPNGNGNGSVHKTLADEAFLAGFNHESPKSFDQLTFSEYMELILNKEQWHRYSDLFAPTEPDALRKLLDGIREIRNDLAHFRTDITPQQHDQLKFGSDWLRRHPANRLVTVKTTLSVEAGASIVLAEEGASANTNATPEDLSILVDETLGPNDSRYAPLARYLQRQSIDRERVALSFHHVEEVIGGDLPPYARQHRAFWANDTISHPQSRQWLDAGWRVSSVDMAGEQVEFSRIKELEKAYLDFYGAILGDLRSIANHRFDGVMPHTHSNLVLASLPERGRKYASLFMGFSPRKYFGIGLFIKTGDADVSKRLFDHLQVRKSEIENHVGEPLYWIRADEEPWSSVMQRHPGNITDDSTALAELRAWAVAATVRFYEVMEPCITEAVRDLHLPSKGK